MDFDEYDYLEKTVEDGADDRNGSASKKIKTNDGGAEKSDRSYRKREDDHYGDTVDADADADAGRRSRRSRGDADDELESGSGGRKRERGVEGRQRSSRDDDKDRDRDRRNKERERRERHGDKDVEKGSRDSEKDLSETRDKNRESSRGLDREKDRDRERQSRVKDREKDRHSERESREKTREKDRDRERDKSEKDGDIKEKDREIGREKSESSRERDRKRESRDKDRDRERGSREREREKEKERSRDRDRERERRDREKEKEESSRRSRSRSMSRRHEIDIDRDREIRDREFEPREARRPRDKKETMEPEVDPERDQRTVFAYQMPLKANERDVYEFFTKAGKVRDVRLIMDRNSRRSKGVGYIEFYDAMSVPMAIALSGHLLHGQPVMVKPSEAEKNLVQSTASAGSTSGVTGPYGPVDRKLYVGNLHFNMTELQLRQIFEPFGTVELVQLPLDLETGHCKGFGFVQFALVEHAKAAQSLNGTLEIAGRVIKVSSVADHVGVQETGAKTADFDDDDGGGLSLNAHSRALLMQKLDRTGVASSITGPLGYPMLNGSAPTQQAMLPANGHTMVPGTAIPGQAFAPHSSEPVGNPSECLLLKNMFDPATQTEPDFDLDIKEEVEDECSNFGRVKHIHLEKHSAGFVYLRFETVEAASKAQRAMHHRWYAGRLISALFMQPHEYEAKFKG